MYRAWHLVTVPLEPANPAVGNYTFAHEHGDDPRTSAANPAQLVYTSSQYPGDYHGCDREAYFGPVYWYNAQGPTTYLTDASGNLTSTGPLQQLISNHADIGISMRSDGTQTQFKMHTSQCVPGLGLKN